MPGEMTVSQARAALPEILNRVSSGEEVTITRHGKAVAVVVRPDVLRGRRADEAFAAAERLRDLMARAAKQPLSPPTMSAERAEELVAEIRAGRSRR